MAGRTRHAVLRAQIGAMCDRRLFHRWWRCSNRRGLSRRRVLHEGLREVRRRRRSAIPDKKVETVERPRRSRIRWDFLTRRTWMLRRFPRQRPFDENDRSVFEREESGRVGLPRANRSSFVQESGRNDSARSWHASDWFFGRRRKTSRNARRRADVD